MTLNQALQWWIDGLAEAILAAQRLLHGTRRFRLDDATQKPLKLRPVGSGAGTQSIELNANLPRSVLELIRGSVVEIAVPPAAILHARLDPLPAESRPYVDNIVQHQIESLFPWRANDIAHTTQVQGRDDGRLDVAVLGTPRSAILEALSAVTALGAGEVMIVAGDESGSAIPVARGGGADAKTARARGVARYAIIGLLVLTMVGLIWAEVSRWTLEGELFSLDQAISDRRAVIQRASDPKNSGAEGGLEARKARAIVATVILEALSSVLPDDTYLTDVSLDGGRLRITGLSPRAAELVPMLEGSGHFNNASFYAPTTRMPGRNVDRFSIESNVVQKAQVKR